jgi:hypothetical protein
MFPFDLSSFTLRALDSLHSPVLDETIARTVEKARQQSLSELVQGQRD